MTKSLISKWMSTISMVLIAYCVQAQWNQNCSWDRRNKTEHLIKTNLLTLPLKTFNLEYERAFSERVTFGVSVNYMPRRDYLFKNRILEEVDERLDKRTIEEGRMNLFSFVPQARFYFGDRETFTRFYFAPYLKFSRYNTDLTLHYQGIQPDNSIHPIDIPVNGKINTYSIGYSFGLQFNVYRSLFLDWKIIGNHYGVARGKAFGYSEYPIPLETQTAIRNDVGKLENIPLYSFDHHIDDHIVEVKPKGIIVGFVTGLSVGYKF